MKKIYFLLALLCFGCGKPESVAIKTELVAHGSVLKITGLDSIILNDVVRSDSILLQILLPVYRMPIDEEMKDYQDMQPGKYKLKSGAVFFKPDTPFLKQQKYFLRYYDYGMGRGVWEFIKNNNHKGRPPYTDLTFTP